MTYVLEFAPPMNNIEGRFNTVRLGTKWGKTLVPGDVVYLLDKPHSMLIGRAKVERVLIGKLGEMATAHAAHNHNQVGLDPEGAPLRLITNMIKRYGPHRCDENKRVTVIYLKRLKR